MRNRILVGVSLLMGIVWMVSVCAVDAPTPTPFIVFCIASAWLIYFCWCNGWIKTK